MKWKSRDCIRRVKQLYLRAKLASEDQRFWGKPERMSRKKKKEERRGLNPWGRSEIITDHKQPIANNPPPEKTSPKIKPPPPFTLSSEDKYNFLFAS